MFATAVIRDLCIAIAITVLLCAALGKQRGQSTVTTGLIEVAR